MVQMVGVIVLALGLQQAFASIDARRRRSTTASWSPATSSCACRWSSSGRRWPATIRRAAVRRWPTSGRSRSRRCSGSCSRSSTCRSTTTFAIAVVLHRRSRCPGPSIAEHRYGGTPWHAHHIAERYGLLVIITLGEGILGTVASINAVVHGSSGLDGRRRGRRDRGHRPHLRDVVDVLRDPVGRRARAAIANGRSSGATATSCIFGVARRDRRRPARRGATTSSTRRDRRARDGAVHGRPGRDLHSSSCTGSTPSFTRHLDPFHLWLLAGSAAVVALSVGACGRRRQHRGLPARADVRADRDRRRATRRWATATSRRRSPRMLAAS